MSFPFSRQQDTMLCGVACLQVDRLSLPLALSHLPRL